MKSITSIAVLIILSCVYCVPAKAQGEYPSLLCSDCGDPRDHPRDFRNFAYNQVFGPDGDMTYDEGDFFEVTNSEGQSVFVDLNMDIGLLVLDLGLPIPLPIPTEIHVQVILIYANGDRIEYRIDPRAHPDGLPVGRRRTGDRHRGRGAGPSPGPGPDSGVGGPPAQATTQRRKCGITRVDGGRARTTCL